MAAAKDPKAKWEKYYATLAARRARKAANERVKETRAVLSGKIEKLGRLASDAGATPAEAENARQKRVNLQAKSDGLRTPYDSPPLPPLDELMALRKGRKPKPVVTELIATDEVAALKAEIDRLVAENDQLRMQLSDRPRVGRKPIGDRAMTAAERMRRMRALRKG